MMQAADLWDLDHLAKLFRCGAERSEEFEQI
jgi:hypothetical protein